MKIITLICRLFVGLLFIFSGFVKSVDPLGSTYKFSEYLKAMGLEWAEPAAFVLAVFLSSAEFIIGGMLIFGVKRELAAWGGLLFMLLFTPLTLWLAISNKVTDCGCFGDALHLDNWGTFYKNLVILVPVLVLFFRRKTGQKSMTGFVEWSIVGGIACIVLIFTVHSYNHLPIIDFRPYAIDKNLSDGMKIPDVEKNNIDVYETVLFYTKDGERKMFTMENLPDDTWEFESSETELIHEGYHPPIHDFSIENEEGDITEKILSDEGYTFLLVAYDLSKADKESFAGMHHLASYSWKNNASFYCLTASGSGEIDALKNDIISEIDKVNDGFAIPFCNTDEKTLKTIIRSNPGLLLLKHGTVIQKWHYNDFPTVEDIREDYGI